MIKIDLTINPANLFFKSRCLQLSNWVFLLPFRISPLRNRRAGYPPAEKKWFPNTNLTIERYYPNHRRADRNPKKRSLRSTINQTEP